MSHKVKQEELTFWDDWESAAIDEWLESHGYSTNGPTICGSCCGYYSEERSARLSQADMITFNLFAAEKGIEAVASSFGIRIDTLPILGDGAAAGETPA